MPTSAPPDLVSQYDLHLFNEGTHRRLYERFGAHAYGDGVHFAVWAPNAEHVSAIGDFNGWEAGRDTLRSLGSSGVWAGTVAAARPGHRYKYHVRARHGNFRQDKADPFALATEVPPRTASVVADLTYTWRDQEWMRQRHHQNALDRPVAVYEMHVGSWRRIQDRLPTYQELARELPGYLRDLGYTHVEFLPIMEHPFYGSWGYQTTGYFAPTSRYGRPTDFMALVDALHQAGIGVWLDWVPSHFPTDAHALASFDGTHIYEHADPRQGLHPDWHSAIFNYGRNEVRSFLLSSAHFWLDVYHADGLRVDAVASMLYLDYSRPDGQWIPNRHGGRENLEAIDFLRDLNQGVYAAHRDVQTVAEESTSWPMVSRPTHVGGLGFGLKWDMGWMHDTLAYLAHDPIHRKYHHDRITFRLLYAFHENFLLPLSHDEVVHGKGSLLQRMPGDEWQQRANLRLLYGLQYLQPGKKLLFMGGEIGQSREWNHDRPLDWHLLADERHAGIQRWIRDLNAAYRTLPALHELDVDPSGFEWVDCTDVDQSIVAWLRYGRDRTRPVLAACNLTPAPRSSYVLGVPQGGRWRERLNSDATPYGGSGDGNLGGVQADPEPAHGRSFHVRVRLPPLSVLVLEPELNA